MAPVFDPLTNSVYLEDGWGTPFASLSLRRLALEDGSQTGALRLRAPTFSVCFVPEGASMLVASGKRLIEIDRRTWAELQRWESGIPRYAHYSALVGRHALLMSWLGPSLSIFDLTQATCSRKKIGSCSGLFVRSIGDVLVCSGKEGIISTCLPENLSVRQLTTIEPFRRAVYLDEPRLLVLALGEPFEVTSDRVQHYHVSEQLAILRLDGSADQRIDIRAPASFDTVWVSSDAQRFFFGQSNFLRICTFDGRALVLAEEIRLPEALEPLLVIPERSIALVADTRSDKGRLEAWSL
jgi:hypothetical protein